MIPCKYESIGCDVELKRKDMKSHEQNESVHFCHALQTIQQMKETITLRNGESFRFKVDGWESKKKNDEEITLPSFYNAPNGYLTSITVYPNGIDTHKGRYTSVIAEIYREKFNRTLEWPFRGRIIIELLNQLDDDDHYEVTLKKYYRVPSEPTNEEVFWCHKKFISHSSISDSPPYGVRYIKDDTLYFRVTVITAAGLNSKPWLECTAIN